MTIPSRFTSVLLCLGAIAMLLFALLGEPPDSYFQFMKFVVVGSTVYIAIALYTRSEKLVPLSLCLVALGALEALGKMEREEWAVWNWSLIGLLLVSLCIVAWKPKVSKALSVPTAVEALPSPCSEEATKKDIRTFTINVAQRRQLSNIVLSSDQKPIVKITPERGYGGILAGMAVTFADTLSETDKAVVARWAGLARNVWNDEHKKAFASAFMHHAKGESVVSHGPVVALRNAGKELDAKDLPPLPAPLTQEIRALLNRMFEA